MRVRIEVLPWLSELVNGNISRRALFDEEIPDRASLRDLLVQVHRTRGPLGRMVFDLDRLCLTGHAEITVNGVLVDRSAGLDRVLHEADSIALLPGISGGEAQGAGPTGTKKPGDFSIIGPAAIVALAAFDTPESPCYAYAVVDLNGARSAGLTKNHTGPVVGPKGCT